MQVVKGIVHQPFEVKGSSIFYAFSYYYDRAVDSGLIGKYVYIRDKGQCYGISTNYSSLKVMLNKLYCLNHLDGSRGGTVEVRDFKKRAKEGKTLDVLSFSKEHSGQSPAAHIAQT